MLVLSRKLNEDIIIGSNIKIRILEIRKDRVRIGIDAPEKTSVHRKEVYEKISQTSLLEGNTYD